MSRALRVLLLEDRQDDASLILHELRRAGFQPDAVRVETHADFAARLDPGLDLILADFNLPQFDALQAVRMVAERGLDVPVIVVTGALGDEAAVECLKQGAADYLIKDRLARLGQAVTQAVEQRFARADRRRAELALRESEARKTAILETALDGIITLDHRGSVLEFNPAAEAIFGCSRGQALGRVLSELFAPRSARPTHSLSLAEYFRGGEGPAFGRRVEVTAARADGEAFVAELSVARIREDGPPVFTCYVRDITERKRAEQELKAARDAAVAANSAKDRFLAVLSHELRTPLSPVLMTVTAMLEMPPSPDEVAPTLAMIRDNIELESRLIDDLLDVSRIAGGKLRLDREVVDVHAVIRGAIEICRPDISKAGLNVSLDLSAERFHADADPVRLRQIFWNLVKNAVKFSRGLGGIISLKSRDEPGRMIVEVTDTGIGIEPSVLPKLFRLFEQGDSSSNRRYEGLGLGLSISQSVAEAHGGRLTASSAGKDMGATFLLELPTTLNPPHAPRPRPSERTPPPLAPVPGPKGDRPLKVMLVEDNEPTLRSLSRALCRRQYWVKTASNLAEARELALSEDFDLLISDIDLPDGSGLELMHEIKATRGFPGIAVSGFGSDKDVKRSSDAGFSEHLTKPVDLQKLEAVMRRVASPDGGA